MGCFGRVLMWLAALIWLVAGIFTGEWRTLTEHSAQLTLVGMVLVGLAWLPHADGAGPYPFLRFVMYVSVPIAAWIWGAGASFSTAFWWFFWISAISGGCMGLVALNEKYSP